jgi:TPR repeat protein
MTKYERALKLMRSSGRKTRRVYELLIAADASGDARATYALATWFLHGTKFTKKNIAHGTRLLQLAASKNIPNALYDLAVSYEQGVEVRKSKRQAFNLYLRAALLGERQSIYEVGRMYYYGIGVRKNRRLAEIWLDCAELRGITQ